MTTANYPTIVCGVIIFLLLAHILYPDKGDKP